MSSSAIDVNQVKEMRAYLKSLGGEISTDLSEKGLEDDLQKIIGVCDILLKDVSSLSESGHQASNIEMVLNAITSMIQQDGLREKLVLSFCDKLCRSAQTTSTSTDLISLKILWSLFLCLEESNPLRFQVYYYLVMLGGKTNEISLVFSTVENFKSQFSDIMPQPSNEQMQKMLRLLHQVLLKTGSKSMEASQVMIKLLETYTTDNASEAREEAQRCIVASLDDPNTFLLDHLLKLKPVGFLEGELIHDLLKIFVYEPLPVYQKFYEDHKDFVVKTLGLSHEKNLTKIKLLTFMQLVEDRVVVDFNEICEKVQIKEDEVEQFVLDLLTTRLVTAKINEGSRTVHVTSTMHRTFGQHEWSKLLTLLTDWRHDLGVVSQNISEVASKQKEVLLDQQKDERSLQRHIMKSLKI